mmetsp:Transcript_22136/g.48218  ORF Transcript_22136/g.48218 Transcript_22136/m.48218 type:complete len:266 (+) Transcript_22136:264-1061(+)|eukprot:CAMPEP_0178519292 /NCGR_PEP_ID=MMETSP0696-20121128/26748_1 /TAXON_ID=265572 /ORGANISM="Extubocellulus spinifer, Strain CCMP396" /LENGTH=265 /DNA_ID=CAMNT_0020149983 /DNA_START=201 /DNA_END=998 /DNA_ORIENTATION=+
MVLCDGGMTVNLLASAMMNGVCCLHGIQAEEDRHQRQRDELRRTINVEYERQRLFDKECRDRMKREEQLLQEIEEQKRRVVMNEQRVAITHYDTRALHTEPSSASQAVEKFLGATPQPVYHTNDAMLAGGPIGLDNRARSIHCPRRALMARKIQLSTERQASKNYPGHKMSRCRTDPVPPSPLSSSGASSLRANTMKRNSNVSWYGMADDQFRVTGRSSFGTSTRVWSDDMSYISQTSTHISDHSLFDDADEESGEEDNENRASI